MSNQAFAEENYIVPDASSTCELVFDMLEVDKITKEIAECLYTGMVHDTGVFQYSCTSEKTMNIAGVLMEKGIEYSKIIDDTFYTKTYNQNRILGKALLDSKLYLDGKLKDGMSKTILSYSKKIMKDFDNVRNNMSPAHFNNIISNEEAEFICTHIINLLGYLTKVNKKRKKNN